MVKCFGHSGRRRQCAERFHLGSRSLPAGSDDFPRPTADEAVISEETVRNLRLRIARGSYRKDT